MIIMTWKTLSFIFTYRSYPSLPNAWRADNPSMCCTAWKRIRKQLMPIDCCTFIVGAYACGLPHQLFWMQPVLYVWAKRSKNSVNNTNIIFPSASERASTALANQTKISSHQFNFGGATALVHERKKSRQRVQEVHQLILNEDQACNFKKRFGACISSLLQFGIVDKEDTAAELRNRHRLYRSGRRNTPDWLTFNGCKRITPL